MHGEHVRTHAAEEPERAPEEPPEDVPDGTETPDLPLGVPAEDERDEDAPPELPGFPQTDPSHG